MRTAGLLLSLMVSVGSLPAALGAPRETVESMTNDSAGQRLLVVVEDSQPVSRVLVVFPRGDALITAATGCVVGNKVVFGSKKKAAPSGAALSSQSSISEPWRCTPACRR